MNVIYSPPKIPGFRWQRLDKPLDLLLKNGVEEEGSDGENEVDLSPVRLISWVKGQGVCCGVNHGTERFPLETSLSRATTQSSEALGLDLDYDPGGYPGEWVGNNLPCPG